MRLMLGYFRNHTLLTFLSFAFIMGMPTLAIGTGGKAVGVEWTAEKLDRVIIRMHQAARKKHWSRAINQGKKMLEGFASLGDNASERYVHQLKNLILFYDQANRLIDAGEKVKKAYRLSMETFGPLHNTTIVSRNLLYKLMIQQKRYSESIPLVQENIDLLSETKDPDILYRRHHYLSQLQSLYALTEQLENQQATLERLIELDHTLFPNMKEERREMLELLGQNLCRQQKLEAFGAIVAEHDLKLMCPIS